MCLLKYSFEVIVLYLNAYISWTDRLTDRQTDRNKERKKKERKKEGRQETPADKKALKKETLNKYTDYKNTLYNKYKKRNTKVQHTP